MAMPLLLRALVLTRLAVPWVPPVAAGGEHTETASAARLAARVPLATRAPLMGLARAGDRLVAVGDYGVVLLSDDAGATWRQAREVHTRDTLTAAAFVDARHGFAVGHGGTVLRTQDGGETWTLAFAAGSDVALLSVAFADAQNGRAVGAFGYAIGTRDGGVTWQRIGMGEGDDRDRHLNAVFGRGSDVYIAAEGGTVFHASGGESFVPSRLPYNGSMWGGLVLRDGSVLVFGMRGHAFRSTDRGVTWTEVATGTEQSFAAGIERADGQVVLVGLSGAIATSRDGGRSFATVLQPDRQSYSGVGEARGRTLAIVGLGGVVAQVPPR
jgi:photosystem II stability/assembly factor-like uncharacterized protein